MSEKEMSPEDKQARYGEVCDKLIPAMDHIADHLTNVCLGLIVEGVLRDGANPRDIASFRRSLKSLADATRTFQTAMEHVEKKIGETAETEKAAAASA